MMSGQGQSSTQTFPETEVSAAGPGGTEARWLRLNHHQILEVDGRNLTLS